MKTLILICVTIVGCASAPISEAEADIIKFDNTQDGKGSYDFSFQTSNGIRRFESGTLVNAGQENEHIQVHGSYSYIDTDGKLVVVYYTADENGYHVEDLQTASAPIPPAALATLLGG